jgi:protein-S-isoprenylcysteine O-methyltransferase Ste14
MDEGNIKDHADVAFHPPVMLILFLVMGFGLRAVVPLDVIDVVAGSFLGPMVVFASLTYFCWAMAAMSRNGGSVPTGEPTDVIVSKGPYAYSRNPIYLAMVVLLAGVGLWANSLWFLGLSVLAIFLLQWGVISREETYLERKFGEDYISYKSRVRRWI